MAPNHREAPSTEPSDLSKGLSKQVDVVLEPPRLGRAHRRPRIKTDLFAPLLDQPTPALLAVRTSRSLRARPREGLGLARSRSVAVPYWRAGVANEVTGARIEPTMREAQRRSVEMSTTQDVDELYLDRPWKAEGTDPRTETTRGEEGSMDRAIEAEGLEKRFGEVEALRGVSLAVEPGTVLGLLGPNGTGKTTTVDVLTTALRPGVGTARRRRAQRRLRGREKGDTVRDEPDAFGQRQQGGHVLRFDDAANRPFPRIGTRHRADLGLSRVQPGPVVGGPDPYVLEPCHAFGDLLSLEVEVVLRREPVGALPHAGNVVQAAEERRGGPLLVTGERRAGGALGTDRAVRAEKPRGHPLPV